MQRTVTVTEVISRRRHADRVLYPSQTYVF